MKTCPRCGRFFGDDAPARCPDDGERLEAVAAAPAADPLIGHVLDGRFHVIDKLGEGGMGAVYRAIQTSVERQVALKVIRGGGKEDLTARFMLEARATSRLKSPHTVTIHDFGAAHGGLLYLAMELLEGESLSELLARSGVLPWRRALAIVVQVADSLEEAHAKQIVHRDLKPGNLFVTPLGSRDLVKVLDFGVAKLLGATASGKLTSTGATLGTPHYMAPEQARAERIDHRADLYSLGVVLYEMLAGRPPFLGETPVSVMMQHCTDPVPPLRSVSRRAGVPEGVERLLEWLLRKRREDRPDAAAAVGAEARRLLETRDAAGAVPAQTAERGSTTPYRAPVDPPAAPLGVGVPDDGGYPRDERIQA